MLDDLRQAIGEVDVSLWEVLTELEVVGRLVPFAAVALFFAVLAAIIASDHSESLVLRIGAFIVPLACLMAPAIVAAMMDYKPSVEQAEQRIILDDEINSILGESYDIERAEVYGYEETPDPESYIDNINSPASTTQVAVMLENGESHVYDLSEVDDELVLVAQDTESPDPEDLKN